MQDGNAVRIIEDIVPHGQNGLFYQFNVESGNEI